MTRINVSIPPSALTDEHLRAEHREIKRLPSNYKKRLEANKFDDVPPKLTLGKGHVLFFIDKGQYTLTRYTQLHVECIKRGFKAENYLENWRIYETTEHFQDYTPQDADYDLIRSRIVERINASTIQWHYYGEPVSKEQAIKLLDKE